MPDVGLVVSLRRGRDSQPFVDDGRSLARGIPPPVAPEVHRCIREALRGWSATSGTGTGAVDPNCRCAAPMHHRIARDPLPRHTPSQDESRRS